jgi:hypothetical protein
MPVDTPSRAAEIVSTSPRTGSGPVVRTMPTVWGGQSIASGLPPLVVSCAGMSVPCSNRSTKPSWLALNRTSATRWARRIQLRLMPTRRISARTRSHVTADRVRSMIWATSFGSKPATFSAVHWR